MEIEQGPLFPSIEEAKKEIKRFCLQNFHAYQVKYSNKILFTTICKNPECSFTISCYKRKDQKVYVSKCNLQHTCDTLNNPPKVSSLFIAERIAEPKSTVYKFYFFVKDRNKQQKQQNNIEYNIKC